jgi:gliding motility-associated-like protein
VDVTMRVDANFLGNVLTNKAEISAARDDKGNSATDVDSTPDDTDGDKLVTDDNINGNGKTGGDEDDSDPASVGVLISPPAGCSLTIGAVTVQGGGNCNCQGSGTGAKVVATISWTNYPAGTTINVVLGSQVKSVNPATQSSPATVEFTNVSAGTGKVIATYANGTCGTEKAFNVPAATNDKTAPVFSGIPADLTLACGAAIPAVAVVTASDNCSGTVPVTVKEEPIGTKCSCSYGVKRTWTAVDACGNKAEFTQTITIIDNVGPVITTVHPLLKGKKNGDTIVINCSNPVIFEASDVTLSDNCCTENLNVEYEDFATAVSGNCAKDGYLTLLSAQWTASDNCGNQSTFKVILKVVDNTAPVLSSLPANLSLSCSGGAVPPATVLTASDDCDDDVKVTFSEERVNSKCAGSYTLLRKWTAIDDCGNVVSHTQTITVGDNTAPVIKPTHPLLVGKASGDTVVIDCKNPFIFETQDVSVTDDCNPGNIEVVFDDYATAISGNCSKDGYMMLMFCQWTAIDKCGNESRFKIIVKVVDRTAPVFLSKPADLTVDLCKGQTIPALAKLNATDDCSEIVAVNGTETKQGAGCDYVLVRTYSAEDSCGNVATHIQKITVIGLQPVISSVAVVQTQCGVSGSITINATGCAGIALKYSINGGQTYQTSNVFTGLGSGTYNVVVSSADGACTVNYSTPVVLQSTGGDLVADKAITIDQDNCEGTAEYCLPISNANILNYTITVNGVVNNSAVACGVFNEMSYFYGTIPGNGAAGPYKVDSWKVGNATLTGQFNDINGLVSLMNTLDPNGIWRHESATKTIQGGVKTVTYGKMEISQVGTAGKATLNPNAVQTAKGTSLTLKVGANKIVIVDKVYGCKDTVDVTVKGKSKPGTCPDVIAVKTAILVSKVCAAGADFCMEIPFANINNYLITDNGKVYTGAKSTCAKGSSINLAEGTHKLVFTDNATCCSDSVTVKVVCIKTDVIKGTTKIGQTGIMLNDVTELPGKLVELKVLPTRNGAQGGITTTAITSSTEVIFQGNQEGVEEFDVVATDEYGITDTTKYIITVVSRVDNNSTAQFEIYNAISPNGDGTNDVLVIKNIEKYSDNTLMIFDRWGAQVLNQKDYSNDWNATWNGKELPDGTYFYIFTAGKDVRQSGYIEVKR